MNTLIDTHGRRIRKLRVSLTDACNFRCFYCMPEKVKFLNENEKLTSDEIAGICKTLATNGIDEIRITGGEPTLHREFDTIVDRLSQLPIRKLGLTSNGYLLKSKLPVLINSLCLNLNISLDSLNSAIFQKVNRTSHFDTVFSVILEAKKMGFNVKINTVVFKGINDHELSDFVEFSARYLIPVRFLELMKIGPYYQEHSKLFVSADEMIQKLSTQYDFKRVTDEFDSTAFNFKTSHHARIGFIASESKPFCKSCSRLRLSPTGELRSCLMSEFGINLKNRDSADYPKLIRDVMALKPFDRVPFIEQPMYQIGG